MNQPLFCIVTKHNEVVRAKKGKMVVGSYALVKRFLPLYRGGKLVRYHGQPAAEVR